MIVEANNLSETKEQPILPDPTFATRKVAVLIGNGGRLQAIVAGTQIAGSRAELALVVSYKQYSVGLEWARQNGLAAQYLGWADWKAKAQSRAEFDIALADLLEQHKIELVVLAGWGLLLSPPFLARFPGRLINVHPALLTATLADKVALSDGRLIPVFRGNHAIEEAWAAKVPVTGCTVHYVTEEMDIGPVILKREVPRLPDDTLESLKAHIHAAEEEILPLAIQLVCQKLILTGEEPRVNIQERV